MTDHDTFHEPQTRKLTKKSLNATEDEIVTDSYETSSSSYEMDIKWRNVIIFIYLHATAIYAWTLEKKLSTVIIGWILGILAGFGTTVGSHRLFTHRTFKANQKLKILMVILQTMAGQEPVLRWARDHRVHHKFTDTNADPYNSRRGFFFSHIGWLMVRKHPDVIEQGKKVDMTDLKSDPALVFQDRYFLPLMVLATFVIPTMLVYYVAGDSFSVAWNGNIMRYLIGLHVVWMVNSVAHLWGAKPYDRNISPTDTYFVGFCALGEGWHNYHHIFPWDYKTAELPTYGFNLSTAFIDFFAWLGWASDLKTVPGNIVKSRILRTGDGSHEISKMAKKVQLDQENNNIVTEERDVEHFWGYGDKDMTKEDMRNIHILKRSLY